MGNNASKYMLDASIDEEEHLSLDALVRYFMSSCTKNPGHQNFIPAKEFRESHLPTRFQHGKVLSLIKAVSDLTVRVIIRNTSEQRPPGDKLYKMKGMDCRRFGSGMVIDIVTVEYDPSGICTCAICAEYPDKPSFTARVYVSTACHVFFDASEVAGTEAELFYDDEKDRKSVKKLYGSNVLEQSEEEDTCLFECITHDKDLADTLMYKLNSLYFMEEEVRKIPLDSPDSLSFVASHPHGASKHISIGYTEHPRDTPTMKSQRSHDLVKMVGDKATSTLPLAQPGTEMKHDTSMVNKNDVVVLLPSDVSKHISIGEGKQTKMDGQMKQGLLKIDGDEDVSLFPLGQPFIEITYDMVNKNGESESMLTAEVTLSGRHEKHYVEIELSITAHEFKTEVLREMFGHWNYTVVVNGVEVNDTSPMGHYTVGRRRIQQILVFNIEETKDTGILLDVLYPDGVKDTINICQLGGPVQYRKKWLLEQKGIHKGHENYVLVVDQPNGGSVEMNDDRRISQYWNYLTTAVRMWFKPRYNYPNFNMSTSTAAHLNTIVESGIPVKVSYPDGTKTTISFRQREDQIKTTKKWLLELEGFHNVHKKYMLVVDQPDGDSVEMDDEMEIDHYWEDLITAVTVWFKREATRIPVDVLYPDGTKTTVIILWQRVKTTKKWLLKLEGFHNVHENYTLVIDLPGGNSVEMDDDRLIDHYWDDLTTATRMWFKEGIPVNVSYPDGSKTTIYFRQREDRIKTRKKWLLEQKGIHKGHENYILVVDQPNGGSVEMNDDRLISQYWNDLTTAVRMWFKPRYNYPNFNMSISKAAHLNTLVESDLEAKGIPVDISYPDGTKTSINFWQRRERIRRTKKWLLDKIGFHNVHKNYTLVIDLPDGNSVEMDDERDINYYWDDLTTAVEMRFKKGTQRVYERGKGRVLFDQKKNCKYNPEHKKFIPVKVFDIKKCNLLKHYQDQLTDRYITSVIRLTVRLAVTYISPQRRDNYPFSEFRGKTVDVAGSGMVCRVLRKFNTNDGKSCPCQQCDRERKNWGIFEVLTSNHVVHNDEESLHTIVYIDYDDCTTDLSSCHKLNGLRVGRSSMAEDRSHVQCVSHDKTLCQKLEKRVGEYNKLHDVLVKAKKMSKGFKIPAICISHPHGYSKHVSVGKLNSVRKGEPYSWRYTTATCPGCSGAPVFILGESLEMKKPYHIAVHSGYGGPGYNESGCWKKEDL